MMMDEGQERVRASYRDNYERLAEVKAKYDPDNLFRINQNIKPSSLTSERRTGRRARGFRAWPGRPRRAAAPARGDATRRGRRRSTRRHAAGGRTARENVDDLVDPGSFVEYGGLAIAAQRGAARARRADRAHAGRRPRRRHRAGQRRAVRRAQRLRGALLRLHGARRDAGRARAPQEGPPVRADRADAAADRVLRRGRRRAARRHGLPRRLRARHARVRAVGAAVGRRAADRRRRRALLRRQRGDRRLLGPDRRDRERLARHGRAGDDRGRRARARSSRTTSGRSTMQAANGVIDVAVADEAEATAVTKRLLGYFQGAAPPGEAPDQDALRDARARARPPRLRRRGRSSRRSPTPAR